MFLCSISADFPYIGHMGAPNDFGRKYGQKMIKICQIFFSKNNNLKAVRKLSFIKNGRTEPIFTHFYDMAQGALPQGVGSTLVKVLSKSSPSITVTNILYFWRLAIVPRPAPRQKVIF